MKIGRFEKGGFFYQCTLESILSLLQDDDDDYYDDFDFDETATSEESDYSEDEEEDIDKEKEPTSKTAEVKEQLSKVTIPEVSSDDESDNSSASYSSSYSSASELSDTEMLEPDDLFIEKPALGYQENTCHQDSRPECIEKKMVREL